MTFCKGCVASEVGGVVGERSGFDESACAVELVDVVGGWAAHRVSPP